MELLGRVRGPITAASSCTECLHICHGWQVVSSLNAAVPTRRVSCPGIGDVVVTDEVRARIESSGLSGCAFLPVDLARIIHIDWTGWDLTAKFPPVHPLSGEPEDFILANEHDELLAHRMGTLWELQLSSGTGVARKASERGRHYLPVHLQQGDAPAAPFRASREHALSVSQRSRPRGTWRRCSPLVPVPPC